MKLCFVCSIQKIVNPKNEELDIHYDGFHLQIDIINCLRSFQKCLTSILNFIRTKIRFSLKLCFKLRHVRFWCDIFGIQMTFLTTFTTRIWYEYANNCTNISVRDLELFFMNNKNLYFGIETILFLFWTKSMNSFQFLY